MEDKRSRFQGHKFILLTSFKRDGGAVETQMYFVKAGSRLFVHTDSQSFKVKRMRRNDKVSVAPCDLRGDRKADPFEGQAVEMPASEAPKVARLFARNYPIGYYWEMLVLRPVSKALARIGVGDGKGDLVFFEIIPGELATDAGPAPLPDKPQPVLRPRLAGLLGLGAATGGGYVVLDVLEIL
jgi:uncharacterized protein